MARDWNNEAKEAMFEVVMKDGDIQTLMKLVSEVVEMQRDVMSDCAASPGEAGVIADKYESFLHALGELRKVAQTRGL